LVRKAGRTVETTNMTIREKPKPSSRAICCRHGYQPVIIHIPTKRRADVARIQLG